MYICNSILIKHYFTVRARIRFENTEVAAKSLCSGRGGHQNGGRLFPMPRKQWNPFLHASTPYFGWPLYYRPHFVCFESSMVVLFFRTYSPFSRYFSSILISPQSKALVRPLQSATEGGQGLPTSSLLPAGDPPLKEVRGGARRFIEYLRPKVFLPWEVYLHSALRGRKQGSVEQPCEQWV